MRFVENHKRSLFTLLFAVLVFFATALVFLSPPEKTQMQRFADGPEGAREFVLYMDELIDALPEKYASLAVTPGSIQLWELEVLPYFVYEGVVNEAKPPTYIETDPTLDPMSHNHLLGFAACSEFIDLHNMANPDEPPMPHQIHLNFRLLNPISSWYQDGERFLPTLIHELAHIQGLCDNGPVDENAAQITTVELLAALVNHGNTLALYGALEEYRDIALSYLHYEAIMAEDAGEDGAVGEFKAFRNEVITDPFERARFAKSQRFWSSTYLTDIRFRGILQDYNWTVWRKMAWAMRTGFAPNMTLPFFAETQGDYRRSGTYEGERPFRMDDFVALVRDAPALVDDLRRR